MLEPKGIVPEVWIQELPLLFDVENVDGDLIRFRFRTAVLVGDLVFFEQIRHFFGHHCIIILNGDQWDFFSLFGLLFWQGKVRLFWMVSHMNQYTPPTITPSDLFKCFQRGFFRELPLALPAGHEVIGLSYG